MTYKFLIESSLIKGSPVNDYSYVQGTPNHSLLCLPRVAGGLVSKAADFSKGGLILTGTNFIGVTNYVHSSIVGPIRRIKISHSDAIFSTFIANNFTAGQACFTRMWLPVMPIAGSLIKKGDVFIVLKSASPVDTAPNWNYVSLMATKDFKYGPGYHPNFNKTCWEEWREIPASPTSTAAANDILVRSVRPPITCEHDIFSIAMSNCALGNVVDLPKVRDACRVIQNCLYRIGRFGGWEKQEGPIDAGSAPSRFALGNYLHDREKSLLEYSLSTDLVHPEGDVVRVHPKMFDSRISTSLLVVSALVLKEGPLTKFNCLPLESLVPFLHADGLNASDVPPQYLCFDGIEEISPCVTYQTEHSSVGGVGFEKISNIARFMGNESYRGQISPKMILRSGYALAESVSNISMYDMRLFDYVPTSKGALDVISLFIASQARKRIVGPEELEQVNSAIQTLRDAITDQRTLVSRSVFEHARKLGVELRFSDRGQKLSFIIPVHCGTIYNAGGGSDLRKILFYQHSEVGAHCSTHMSDVVMAEFTLENVGSGVPLSDTNMDRPDFNWIPISIRSVNLSRPVSSLTSDLVIQFAAEKSGYEGARGVNYNVGKICFADVTGIILESGLTSTSCLERAVGSLMPSRMNARDSLFQVDLPGKSTWVDVSTSIDIVEASTAGSYSSRLHFKGIKEFRNRIYRAYKGAVDGGSLRSYTTFARVGNANAPAGSVVPVRPIQEQGRIRPIHIWSKGKYESYLRRDIHTVSTRNRNIYFKTGVLLTDVLSIVVPTYDFKGQIDLSYLCSKATAVDKILSQVSSAVASASKLAGLKKIA